MLFRSASAATALATTVDRISLRQSDTANGGHDTGAYGSAGTFVAGLATKIAAENLAVEIKAFAATSAATTADGTSNAPKHNRTHRIV